MKTASTLLAFLALASFDTYESNHNLPSPDPIMSEKMNLGAFSVSLAVKDLAKSEAFYKKLGFEQAGGEAKQGWLIMP